MFRKFGGCRIVHPDEATAPCPAFCPLQLEYPRTAGPREDTEARPASRVNTISRRLRQRGRSFNSAIPPRVSRGEWDRCAAYKLRVSHRRKSGILIRQVLVRTTTRGIGVSKTDLGLVTSKHPEVALSPGSHGQSVTPSLRIRSSCASRVLSRLDRSTTEHRIGVRRGRVTAPRPLTRQSIDCDTASD